MTCAELLASVRRVEVRTNRLVNDTMAGAYAVPPYRRCGRFFSGRALGPEMKSRAV